MAVEYAGILAAVSLMAITLTGAYGKSISAVHHEQRGRRRGCEGGEGAEGLARRREDRVQPRPLPQTYPEYLYALGWIGGTKNPGQCGLTLLGQDAAKDQACEMRANAKLVAQLKRRSVTVSAAAGAVTAGVVSAVEPGFSGVPRSGRPDFRALRETPR